MLPKSFKDAHFSYCPGCGHGIVHRLIGEIIDELGIQGKVVGTAPVGCSVLFYNYLDVDMIECAHGRPPAVATGIKRVNPELVVFTYQGDGDLASIGTAEIIHAANRGENITAVFINNAVYGMTGGQMAPTTLEGQKTTTTPAGRGQSEGKPLKVCEMLSSLDTPYYIERVSCHSTANIIRAKKALKKAFENQLNNKGFSFVEVLSMCPTNWRLSPEEATRFIKEKMAAAFPLKVFVDKDQ